MSARSGDTLSSEPEVARDAGALISEESSLRGNAQQISIAPTRSFIVSARVCHCISGARVPKANEIYHGIESGGIDLVISMQWRAGCE